jgi:hypothetical protein
MDSDRFVGEWVNTKTPKETVVIKKISGDTYEWAEFKRGKPSMFFVATYKDEKLVIEDGAGHQATVMIEDSTGHMVLYAFGGRDVYSRKR